MLHIQSTGKPCSISVFTSLSHLRGLLTSLLLPPALEAWATDELTVRAADHKVLHHLQRVHNIPTMPWLLRSCLGVSSSLVMMHMLGW
jgi:hypothetical protein